MTDTEIRPFTAGDADAVSGVHRRAFGGRTEEARIVQRVHDTEKAVVSLVAVEDEHVVGHVLFSPTSVDGQAETLELVGLAPVGVLPERQDERIGSSLTRHGLAGCRDAGVDAVVVVVVVGDPGYYPRFGFDRASGDGLGNEYGAEEASMVEPSTEGALDDVAGTVVYRPEFREGDE